MKILFTGGGSGGHITPAIAMADAIKKTNEKCEILFIGRKGGGENALVKKAGYPIKEVNVRGLSRRIGIKQIKDSVLSMRAISEAGRIISEYKPDLTVATGGYASFPALAYSTLHGIPTVIHESNAYPGLVTRLFAKRARIILLGLEGARQHLPKRARIHVTGNPTRAEFENIDRDKARAGLGATGRVMILSVGGSGGAASINDAAVGLMKGYSKDRKNVIHIHITGRCYYENTIKSEADLIKSAKNIKIIPFAEDMPRYLCAADIVISRSGAMTVSELMKVGCPSILIPSPNVTDDHQMKNAEEAKEVGGAVIIPEHELSVERLIMEVDLLVRDKRKRDDLRQGMLSGDRTISDEELSRIITECIN